MLIIDLECSVSPQASMRELDDCLNAGVLEKDFTKTAVQVCDIAVCMRDVCEGWTVKHLSKIRPLI